MVYSSYDNRSSTLYTRLAAHCKFYDLLLPMFILNIMVLYMEANNTVEKESSTIGFIKLCKCDHHGPDKAAEIFI